MKKIVKEFECGAIVTHSGNNTLHEFRLQRGKDGGLWGLDLHGNRFDLREVTILVWDDGLPEVLRFVNTL